MIPKEIWKEYPIKEKFEGFYRIEVSDKGNLKTYNALFPKGKLVNGSIQSGYKILRTKLRKKWNDKDTEKITEINQQIDELNAEIKAKKNKKEFKNELPELRENRDNLVQKRKKLNTKLTNKNNINIAILFHKAVAEIFLEKPKTKAHKFVIHKDFDKFNNAVENLEWATQKDLGKRQSKHPKMILRQFNKQFMDHVPQVKNSKLGEMEVLRIKRRLKRGDTLKQLAKQFNVSDMQIHRIKSGENWSHVKLIEDIKEEKNEK